MKSTLPKILLLGLVFALFSFKVSDGPKKAAPGTYQLVIKDTKREIAYTDEFLMMVEQKRQDHQEVTIPMSPTVDVIIPSRDAINSPSFKPLAEFFYVN